MAGFKNAFEQGLDAAKRADAARKEIKSVFDDLKKQINEIGNGKIQIELRNFRAKVEIQDLMKYGLGYTSPTYWAIVAYNPLIDDSSYKELARWSEESQGYPCKISFGSNSLICEDKSALELALEELLKDPIVGETLYQLMNLKKNESNKE